MKRSAKSAKAAPAKRKVKSAKAPSHRKSPLRGKRYAAAAERAPEIFRRLSAEYPDAKTALDHRNAYELLVATILSAQSTDKRVNIVTPSLFARYPDVESLAAAKPEELENLIKSTGFFRSKTKSLLGMAGRIVDVYGTKVPETMAELVTLPGVGRKTANVVLGNAFGRDEGIVVDTHVSRLSQRLVLTRETDAGKIEQDLMTLFPREQWTMLAHLLISHGRAVCIARRPLCEKCVVSELCPSSRV